MFVETVRLRLAEEGVRVRRFKEELSSKEVGDVLSTNGDRHCDIDQAVLALVDVVGFAMRQSASEYRVAFPAAFGRQWMNSVKLRADGTPAGGNQNVAFSVQNSGDRASQCSETLAQTVQFSDVDQF